MIRRKQGKKEERGGRRKGRTNCKMVYETTRKAPVEYVLSLIPGKPAFNLSFQ